MPHPPQAGHPTLTSLFDQAAHLHAQKTALTLGPETLTYAELSRQSRQAAAALQQAGVTPGSIVAICLDRSPAMIVAMLAVLRAGAAYLPLDPTYPPARLAETLADAQPICLITHQTLSTETPILRYETLASSTATLTPVTISEDDLAYVIYTSGSTGRPKGVQVTHANVTRLFSQTGPIFRFTPHDVWTLFHSFAFDFSVWEIWGALLSGARLVLVPYAITRSPDAFLHLLSTERVTLLNQTPSAFALLDRAQAAEPTLPLALRLIIFGGEALNLRSLAPWFARNGETPQLINMYGITETTVHVTYRPITPADARQEDESLIGQPIPDLSIDLLDEHLRPVLPGVPGEMYIGGPGVARGYLRRPELTAERFLPDPIRGGGSRLYRSGDLARRRGDGELVYLGRADRQVKINGFRVELGELEAALTACPGVTGACALARTEPQSGTRLIAWYTSLPTTTPAAVLAHLEAHLPAHMRPSFLVPIASFPLNANGKIDREALPAPTPAAPATPGIHTPLEQTIAALWQRVLAVETVALDQNFFDAGGTSLLLIAVRTGLQEQLHRAIPVLWLFEHTTIRTLARQLESPPQPSAPLQTNAARQRDSFARQRAIRQAREGSAAQ